MGFKRGRRCVRKRPAGKARRCTLYSKLKGSFTYDEVEVSVYLDPKFGERTLVFGQLHGRGEQSGARVAMPAAGVATWRDGLCVSHQAYPDKDDALRDVGVSGDALEPIAP